MMGKYAHGENMHAEKERREEEEESREKRQLGSSFLWRGIEVSLRRIACDKAKVRQRQ